MQSRADRKTRRTRLRKRPSHGRSGVSNPSNGSRKNHEGAFAQNRRLTLPEKAKINSKRTKSRPQRAHRTIKEFRNDRKRARDKGLRLSAFHEDMETPRDIRRYHHYKNKREVRKLQLSADRYFARKADTYDPYMDELRRDEANSLKNAQVLAERARDRQFDTFKFSQAEKFAKHRIARKKDIYMEYVQDHTQKLIDQSRRKAGIAHMNELATIEKQQVQDHVKSRKAQQFAQVRKAVQFNKMQRFLQKTHLYPEHNVITMPVYSGAMTWGRIINWEKRVGDYVVPGDVLCHTMTSDGQLVSIDATEAGFLAQQLYPSTSHQQFHLHSASHGNHAPETSTTFFSRLNPFQSNSSSDQPTSVHLDNQNQITPGKPVAVIVKDENAVKRFSKFSLHPHPDTSSAQRIHSANPIHQHPHLGDRAMRSGDPTTLEASNARWSRFVSEGIDDHDPYQPASQLNTQQNQTIKQYQSIYPVLFSLRKSIPRFVNAIEQVHDLYQQQYQQAPRTSSTPPTQPSKSPNFTLFSSHLYTPSNQPRHSHNRLPQLSTPSLSAQYRDFMADLVQKKQAKNNTSDRTRRRATQPSLPVTKAKLDHAFILRNFTSPPTSLRNNSLLSALQALSVLNPVGHLLHTPLSRFHTLRTPGQSLSSTSRSITPKPLQTLSFLNSEAQSQTGDDSEHFAANQFAAKAAEMTAQDLFGKEEQDAEILLPTHTKLTDEDIARFVAQQERESAVSYYY